MDSFTLCNEIIRQVVRRHRRLEVYFLSNQCKGHLPEPVSRMEVSTDEFGFTRLILFGPSPEKGEGDGDDS